MRAIVRPAVFCVLFFSVVTSMHAQVTVRCGAGSTTVAGMHINNQGEVVVSETAIVCGQAPGGPVMPNPLHLAILSPPGGQVVNIGPQPVSLPFSASILNYAAANDQCSVTVLSPGGGAAAIPNNPTILSPSNNQASATLLFPPGLASGTYSLALQCTRTVNGQQVVVNNPAPRVIVVNSSTIPTQCPPIYPHFSPDVAQNYTSPYGPDGGWGALPNQAVSWRPWTLSRTIQSGWLVATQLRRWKFTAPPDSRMLLQASGGIAHELVMSVSECPGDFRPNLGNCLAAAGMVWRSGSTGFANDCVLNPGAEYYLNIAVFDLPHYLVTGELRSTVGCPNAQCVVDMRATSQ